MARQGLLASLARVASHSGARARLAGAAAGGAGALLGTLALAPVDASAEPWRWPWQRDDGLGGWAAGEPQGLRGRLGALGKAGGDKRAPEAASIEGVAGETATPSPAPAAPGPPAAAPTEPVAAGWLPGWAAALFGGGGVTAAGTGTPREALPELDPDAPLPTDKLAGHLSAAPRAARDTSGGLPGVPRAFYAGVVLVECGSFDPPTAAHLRALDVARDALRARGADVLGAYLSPVSDAYWKQGLSTARARAALCRSAAEDSSFVMVDAWEAAQDGYTRTLTVLRHVEDELSLAQGGDSDRRGEGEAERRAGRPAESQPPRDPSRPLRAVLVCGADVLESMADPRLWRQDLLEELLRDHGIVAVARPGSDAARVLDARGSLLNRYRASVLVVHDPLESSLSSSLVRREVQCGRSVRGLVAPGVERLVGELGLYGAARAPDPPAPLHAPAPLRAPEARRRRTPPSAGEPSRYPAAGDSPPAP